MRTLVLIFCAVGLTVVISCGEGNIVVREDPSVQRAIDIGVIEDYLTSKGYNPATVDTTESGVRWVVIDEGQTGDANQAIDESDIVDFDFIGRLTDDKLFDTTIESVALQDTAVHDSSTVYIPVLINYSSTGWTLGSRFISGFRDGISATFNKVHVGGHILIVIPSDLAYGPVPPPHVSEAIPENAVLAFELFPVRVTKQ